MSKTKVPETLVGPLLQSFFMEQLCHHKRLSPQTVKSLSGYMIFIPTSARVSLPQGLHRPDGVCASDQKSGEAERKYGVAQACAEVLPEGRSCAGIVRREEQDQHKDESAEACGTYHDAEN